MFKFDKDDDMYVEALISSARARMLCGMPDVEVHEELMDRGASSAEAHHAIMAAQILENNVT